MGKTNSRGNFRGSDDWLDKEPTPFVPINRNQLNQTPLDCWGEEGETGIPKSKFLNSKYGTGDNHFVHVTLEGAVQDLRDSQAEIPTPEDLLIEKEEEEAKWTERETCAAMAGVKLIEMLALTPTKAMCHVVGIYLNERMDGVIKHYFANWRDTEVKAAVLEFCEKMREYEPKISQEVGGRLYSQAQSENKAAAEKTMHNLCSLKISSVVQLQVIKKAQLERQLNGKVGPYSELGEALYGDRFSRLLRAK